MDWCFRWLFQSWGNSRLNTTTKPLFEETLSIVFECFDKFNNNRPILPIDCLKNYQLIYNEDDDVLAAQRDDNQVVFERLSLRYPVKESLSCRSSITRSNHQTTTKSRIIQNVQTEKETNQDTLPLIQTTNERTSLIDTLVSSSQSALPNSARCSSIPPLTENTERSSMLSHRDDIELEKMNKCKEVKSKSSVSSSRSTQNQSLKLRKSVIRRVYSTNNLINNQRKKRSESSSVIVSSRRYESRTVTESKQTESVEKNVANYLNHVMIKEERNISTTPFETHSNLASSVNFNPQPEDVL